MRYRIEYLAESTNECSVCKQVLCDGALEGAVAKAWTDASEATGANGFQIRDLDHEARIVVLETFNDRRVVH